METISVIGVDLAKDVFQVLACKENGKRIWSRSMSRKKFTEFWQNCPPCRVFIEACGSSHYWGRKLQSLGFDVKLIAPQHVKPFVKTNKSDFNDAEAIVEAGLRPTMRFVPIKTIEQQDVQTLHRVRQRLVSSKTQLVNEMRGFLREYGIVIPLSIGAFNREILNILEDASNGLSDLARQTLNELLDEYKSIRESVLEYDKKIKNIVEQNEICQRLSKIHGVGVVSSTALFAKFGKASEYKNGRALAAAIGLVPRHSGSGGVTKVLSISKRGDPYIRSLLIHGARAVVSRAKKLNDPYSRKICEMERKIGFNKTTVAIANRNARVAWVLMCKGEEYKSPRT
jgi:transposase